MAGRLSRWGAAVVLLATATVSCTQLLGGRAEIRSKRIFRIDVEPVTSYLENSSRPYDITVLLENLDVASSHNRMAIISSSSRYEVTHDALNAWALRPREMLTDVIKRYLRDAQLFRQIVDRRDLLDQRPDYTLKGTVKALERLDSGDTWFARLVLTLELLDDQSRVLWAGEISAADDIEVFNADMEQTVVAMSELLRRKMEHFMRELDFYFLRLEDPTATIQKTETISANFTPSDSLGATRGTPNYYEFIPGKIAP